MKTLILANDIEFIDDAGSNTNTGVSLNETKR